jgi:simple sugar transport system permease protein
MEKSYQKPLFLSLTILLLAVGTVLFLGTYYSGLLFILGAVIVFAAYRVLAAGKDGLLEDIRSAVRVMLVPVVGIFAAIVIGGIIMLITGYNPLTAYGALFYGGFYQNWHISILNAAPLIFTGLSVAFAFKCGLFNIGAEGQYYMGAMAATFFGLNVMLPPLLSIVAIFILAGMFGAAWNIIPATLKARTGAHEVITTMMLAHTARYLSPIFIRANGGDPATSDHPYVTNELPETNWLPRFNSFLPDANYRLHTGILVAIVVALVVYYILYYTKIGFEIRAVGDNKEAARAQGISVPKAIMAALVGAGFLAALAGFNQVVGLNHVLYENLSAGYGWDGISVALLAGGHPIGVVFTGLLWGALDAGGQYMSRVTQVENSIVEIIKGTILFLVVARYIYVIVSQKMKKRRQAKQLAEQGEA